MPRPIVDKNLLARNRIQKTLREHFPVASRQTLEVKLAERGPDSMMRANPPHIVTNAIKDLVYRYGDVRIVAAPDTPLLPYCPCQIYALTTTPDDVIAAVLPERIALETRYHERFQRSHDAVDTVGKAGEAAVRTAIERTRHFIIGHGWGDVRDPRIIGAADGMIYLPTMPSDQSGLLVEVKNKRRWMYHDSVDLWKLVRNAYAIDALPLLFARRIHSPVFDYIFTRIGGLGVEMRTQFAPAVFSEELQKIVEPDALDFFDVRFTTEPGPRFQKRVNELHKHVPDAWARLKRTRAIVEPFLDALMDESAVGDAYWELQRALNEAAIEPISLLRD